MPRTVRGRAAALLSALALAAVPGTALAGTSSAASATASSAANPLARSFLPPLYWNSPDFLAFSRDGKYRPKDYYGLCPKTRTWPKANNLVMWVSAEGKTLDPTRVDSTGQPTRRVAGGTQQVARMPSTKAAAALIKRLTSSEYRGYCSEEIRGSAALPAGYVYAVPDQKSLGHFGGLTLNNKAAKGGTVYVFSNRTLPSDGSVNYDYNNSRTTYYAFASKGRLVTSIELDLGSLAPSKARTKAFITMARKALGSL